MRPRLAPEEQMTIEEFLAFTDTRPDEERWELIEGVPVMNASPTKWHQIIASNICGSLIALRLQLDANWVPAVGMGTLVPVSPHSLPQPDVMVFETAAAETNSPVTDDALVLFEILSKSNTKADQAWRKRVYASIPNCQHYVTVEQNAVSVTRFDRSTGWQGHHLASLDDKLALPALGKRAVLPLAEIYRWTSVGRL
jgi:Uma2 family endonuclease